MSKLVQETSTKFTVIVDRKSLTDGVCRLIQKARRDHLEFDAVKRALVTLQKHVDFPVITREIMKMGYEDEQTEGFLGLMNSRSIDFKYVIPVPLCQLPESCGVLFKINQLLDLEIDEMRRIFCRHDDDKDCGKEDPTRCCKSLVEAYIQEAQEEQDSYEPAATSGPRTHPFFECFNVDMLTLMRHHVAQNCSGAVIHPPRRLIQWTEFGVTQEQIISAFCRTGCRCNIVLHLWDVEHGRNPQMFQALPSELYGLTDAAIDQTDGEELENLIAALDDPKDKFDD